MDARYYNGGPDDDPHPRRHRQEPYPPDPDPEWCAVCQAPCGMFFRTMSVTDGVFVFCTLRCFERAQARQRKVG